MLDIYKTINEKQIILGQTSSGVWYCKELPVKCVKEAEEKIGEINRILNQYNTCKKEKKISKDKKQVVRM
jgi:hypothetical protein